MVLDADLRREMGEDQDYDAEAALERSSRAKTTVVRIPGSGFLLRNGGLSLIVLKGTYG
jgi:hypothetical protein